MRRRPPVGTEDIGLLEWESEEVVTNFFDGSRYRPDLLQDALECGIGAIEGHDAGQAENLFLTQALREMFRKLAERHKLTALKPRCGDDEIPPTR